MKKLSILLIGLLLIAGFASAEVTLSIGGTSTLTWGIQGQLIDNSANFGSVDLGIDPYTDQSGGFLWSPNDVALTLTVSDDMDHVIVDAASRIELNDPTVFYSDPDTDPQVGHDDIFQYIDFPNVIPDVLGIKLNKSGTISTPVTSGSSTTSQPNILVTATPVDGLTAQLGLVFNQVGLTRTDSALDVVTYDTYLDVAASVYAEYMVSLSDTDSVTVGFGTVFDTAYGNDTYDTANATDATITDQMYGPKVIIAPTAAPAADTNEEYGYASMPIGLSLDAVVSGITAAVDFETRLVKGADLANLDNTGAVRTDWGTPIFANVDLAYEMMMGDMTITPTANFKYSSDFWKWGDNEDVDDTAFEYEGLVQGADFVGRPMSVAIGVDVTGIAGILEVNLTGSAGFGDGEFMHGYSTDLGAELIPSITQATTIAQWNTDQAAAFPDVAGANGDGWLATGSLATKVSLALTATPMDGVTITNTFAYTTDNLGISGFADWTPPLGAGGADNTVLFGDFLTHIDNDTKATYDIMVGDVAVATLFAQLNFNMDTYNLQQGEIIDVTTGGLAPTEQASKSTLGYKVGVNVTVSTD